MSRTNAARLRWAVEVLDPRPGDRILEVGCGVGAAVELVAAHLRRGTILALDRSQPMVAQARRRNAAAIADGRVRIEAVAVAVADLGRAAFDRIFSFNVGLFWRHPAPELPALVRALRPAGVLYVFHQAPVPTDMRSPIGALRAQLASLGLDACEVLRERLHPVPAVCVVARRSTALDEPAPR
ncbi:MAG: class I SAM-dependent methyltransferase [Polyangiaceae bacterium]